MAGPVEFRAPRSGRGPRSGAPPATSPERLGVERTGDAPHTVGHGWSYLRTCTARQSLAVKQEPGGNHANRQREGMMNIEIRNIDATTVVDITGHIDLGSSPALRKTMLECLKGTDRMAANLAGVKYIDSSGIASLLEVLKEARKNQ